MSADDLDLVWLDFSDLVSLENTDEETTRSYKTSLLEGIDKQHGLHVVHWKHAI